MDNSYQEKRLKKLEERQTRQTTNGQNGNDGKNKLTPWLVAILIIMASIYGIVTLSRSGGNNDQKPSPAETALTLPAPDDWVRGNPLAKTVLVEYSDFECPACATYHPIVKKLVAELGSNFAMVYRHFPLPQHLGAKPAAYAAEAAGAQGKFWEMADMIFDNQTKWEGRRNVEKTFEEYAVTLGLNLEKFKTDRDAKVTKDGVDADKASGDGYAVAGTPTFFLNGKKIDNPRSFDDFKKLLSDSISNAPTTP